MIGAGKQSATGGIVVGSGLQQKNTWQSSGFTEVGKPLKVQAPGTSTIPKTTVKMKVIG